MTGMYIDDLKKTQSDSYSFFGLKKSSLPFLRYKNLLQTRTDSNKMRNKRFSSVSIFDSEMYK